MAGDDSRTERYDLDRIVRLVISITTVIGVFLLLRYLFQGGTPPSPPFPQTGADPTEDDLDCAGL